MDRKPIGFVAILFCLCVAACATPASRTNTAATFEWTSPAKRVVLMPADVELGELTAGGLIEPRADWTEAARGHISAHIAETLRGKGVELVDSGNLSEHEGQLARLHNVVGNAILVHLYLPGFTLPNKGDALDWTLGPGTNDLRNRLGADYALFVFVRDSYSTAGRQAMMVAGVLLGVYVPGGQQVGFASLVDLRNGDIVWFNRLISDTGDLRTEEPARRVVDNLIGELPI